MNKPERNFRILSLLFLSLLLTASLSCNKKTGKPAPTIEKGVLDLRGWDFKKDGKIELRGDSEFYFNKVLTAADFDGPNNPKPDSYINLPGLWNSYKINEEEIGYHGYATYRFKVKTDKNHKDFAIKLYEIASAYILYIDSKKIAYSGTFATSSDDGESGRFYQVVSFSPKRSEFNVIIHISNYDGHMAGFYGKTYMGDPREIKTYRTLLLVSEFFVFGCIFIMFFYHLGFYFLRRKDTSTLFFSLMSLCLASYLLSSGELLIYEVFPDLAWGLSVRVMFTTAYLSLGMASYFLYSIFKEEINLVIIHIGNAVCAIFTIISIFASLEVCIIVMITFAGFMSIWAVYFTKVIIMAIKNKRDGALLYLFGCLVLFTTIINDYLHGFHIVATAFLVSYGCLGFIISQAMLLSRRFRNAYATVENLSVDLEQKNIELSDFAQNLEKKVDERTEELKNANDTLLVMHQELVNASETANKDMAIAMNVQAALLPKKIGPLKKWDIAFEFKPLSGISGDLYDYYIDGDSIGGVNICDVSGHGIASGLITMIARSAFYRNFTRYKDSPLGVVMENINKDLIDEIDNVDNYLTSILLRFNGNIVEYVNAGHTDLLRKSGSTGRVEIVDSKENSIKGLYMGISSMANGFNEMTFTLEKDDVIVLYSDCIIESTNTSEEQYGTERLISSFEEASNISAKEVVDKLISDMFSFIDNTELEDDLTIVVMKYLG